MEEEIEKTNVNKLRSLVEDINPDLTYFDLLRWLQGYDNDFDAIVPKLRKHLKFFKDWDFRSFQQHPVVHDHYPFGILGSTGKDDNLVYVECMGRVDPTGMFKSASYTQFIMTRVHGMEIMMDALRAHEKETGKQCKYVFVVDYEHLKLDTKLVKYVTGHYKDFCNYFIEHYVEVFDKFIAVNLPSFAPKIWRIMQKFMPEKTKRKIVILGDTWQKDILKLIHEDKLPVHWGGTMVDENGDPMYRSKIVVPPIKIDPALYWTPGPDDFGKEELMYLPVGAGRMEHLTFHVEKVGSVLQWYFVADNSFGFGVYFSEDEADTDWDNMDMAFPDFGIFAEGTHVPECDKIECKRVGYYKLRFNNYNSWFTTLRVHYKAWLNE